MNFTITNYNVKQSRLEILENVSKVVHINIDILSYMETKKSHLNSV